MNENTLPMGQAQTKVSRPRYDAAFRRAAVEHYRRHGGPITRTAQELGINHWALRDWIRAERAKDTPPAPACTLSEAGAEIARLRAELARVTEQRDILKKSLGILSLS
jgi:transposase-like protein